jgi:hypothetical protein
MRDYTKYSKNQAKTVMEQEGVSKTEAYRRLKADGNLGIPDPPVPAPPPPMTPAQLAREKIRLAIEKVEMAALVFSASTFDEVGVKAKVDPIKAKLDAIASELTTIAKEIQP